MSEKKTFSLFGSEGSIEFDATGKDPNVYMDYRGVIYHRIASPNGSVEPIVIDEVTEI